MKRETVWEMARKEKELKYVYSLTPDADGLRKMRLMTRGRINISWDELTREEGERRKQILTGLEIAEENIAFAWIERIRKADTEAASRKWIAPKEAVLQSKNDFSYIRERNDILTEKGGLNYVRDEFQRYVQAAVYIETDKGSGTGTMFSGKGYFGKER